MSASPYRYRTSKPECPHCGHVFTTENMLDDEGTSKGETDLFSLAPMEERREVSCPECKRGFWIEGSFEPRYTSAMTEDDL